MGNSSAHRLGERILLRLDMQSDGSPHFLRVPQDRPMYHSTSNPRASRSPCEELSGPRRGPFEIGSPTSTRNPNGRLANSRKAAAPRTSARASWASGQKLHYARRIAVAERRACVPTESRAARGGGGRSVGCQ